MNRLALFLLLFSSLSYSQNYSYIWGFHFPQLTDPTEVCCFDYDNDGSIDDGLGDFLLTLQQQSNSSFQAGIDAAILDNSLVKTIDWQDFDITLEFQQFSFDYLDATIITPELNLIERMSGLTQLYLTPVADTNTFDAINNLGFVTATASEITGLLNLQINQDASLTPLTLHNVKAEMQLLESPLGVEPGIYSEDLLATTPEIVGGIKIGGILPSDEFLGVFDTQYRTCSCANVDPNQPLITTSVFLGTLIVSCAQSGLTPENCPVNSFCSTVGDFCSNAIALGTTFDIDENNDGVNDAYSVALKMGAAATTIVDIIFTQGFETL
jgi:hypothetical protein